MGDRPGLRTTPAQAQHMEGLWGLCGLGLNPKPVWDPGNQGGGGAGGLWASGSHSHSLGCKWRPRELRRPPSPFRIYFQRIYVLAPRFCQKMRDLVAKTTTKPPCTGTCLRSFRARLPVGSLPCLPWNPVVPGTEPRRPSRGVTAECPRRDLGTRTREGGGMDKNEKAGRFPQLTWGWGWGADKHRLEFLI